MNFCMILMMFILKGLIYNIILKIIGKALLFTSRLNFLQQSLLFSVSFDVYEQKILWKLTSFSKMMSVKKVLVAVASLSARMPLQLSIILPPTTKFSIIRQSFELPRAFPASTVWIEICLAEFFLKAKLSWKV